MTNAFSCHNRTAEPKLLTTLKRSHGTENLVCIGSVLPILGSRYGLWYVKLIGGEQQFWHEAMSRAPLSYRLFGRTLSIVEIDKDEEKGARQLRRGPVPWYVPKILKNNKKDHLSPSNGGVCPPFNQETFRMVAKIKKRKFAGSKKRFIGKPSGQIQERVQAVGA